jgi:hypothetical protein
MVASHRRSGASPPLSVLLGTGWLAAASLAYEVALTRLLAVAQFHHLAFMVISLAMLGSGASGTLLATWPRLGLWRPRATMAWLAIATAALMPASLVLMNLVPFDAYTIWDSRQIAILGLHYAVLSTPFFCSGAALSLLFRRYPRAIGPAYGANMIGSALGCLLALGAPSLVGGEGVLLLCSLASVIAAICYSPRRQSGWQHVAAAIVGAAALVGMLRAPSILQVRLSPYKGLSYALQAPGSDIVASRWNAVARIDLVQSSTIHALPGLSYRSTVTPPPQLGLFRDADDPSPVLVLDATTAPADEPRLGFAQAMPTAPVYELTREGRALILDPLGGLEVWIALAKGADSVDAAVANPLVVSMADGIYAHPRVGVLPTDSRSAARSSEASYDAVVLPLTAPYRPVRSGAYSLSEQYELTTEAFSAYVRALVPGGVFAVTRWLQTPPSESVRMYALAIAATEAVGGDPETWIVAYRGYTTMTVLIKRGPWEEAELAQLRAFCDRWAFDLVAMPGMTDAEANRHNVLDRPVYRATFLSLLHAKDRDAWYRAYPYQVAPPTDDRPFFGHYFRWRQLPQVLGELGHTWAPFGGAGYLVILALLMMAVMAAAALAAVPVLVGRKAGAGPRGERWRTVAYFGSIGLGYMLVEIPLIQRYTLILGHPAYAFSVVLAGILVFSGLGSLLSDRVRLRPCLFALSVVAAFQPMVATWLQKVSPSWPLLARASATLVALGPLGLLMGIPFAKGLALLAEQARQDVPWAWAINGGASVIASVLAAALALSWGARAVTLLGAACYLVALGARMGARGPKSLPAGRARL